MRYSGILSILVLAVSACKNPDTVSPDMIYFPDPDGADTSTLPVISFQDTLFQFGIVAEGEIIQTTFQFTNTGASPLVLTRLEPSCGCTAAKDWPRDPIAPGEGGSITISFDTNRRAGSQKKSISVIANTYPATTVLYLEGQVLGPQN